MSTLSLFERLSSLPEMIREKIIMIYYGLGSPIAKILRRRINTIQCIKKSLLSSSNMNVVFVLETDVEDMTFWKYIITSRQSGSMLMKKTTQQGLVAFCELQIAHNSSSTCKDSTVIKRERIYHSDVMINSVKKPYLKKIWYNKTAASCRTPSAHVIGNYSTQLLNKSMCVGEPETLWKLRIETRKTRLPYGLVDKSYPPNVFEELSSAFKK